MATDKEKEKKEEDKKDLPTGRLDTPLADTPDPTAPVTKLKTALADINSRIDARKASLDASHKKVSDARIARSKEKRNIAGDCGRLYGLASFASTTGRQTKE